MRTRAYPRRWLLCLCALFTAVGIFAGSLCVSATEVYDDPQYGRAKSGAPEEFYSDGPAMYRLDSGHGKYVLRHGIDVSQYQGNMDWQKAAQNGAEFAFIRVGYRGWGDAGTLREDKNFAQNIEGALGAGIRVGVYIYSQAITEQEAVEEANFVLSRIQGANITMPVVIDFEYASGAEAAAEGGGRLKKANLTREQATAICAAFCRTVEESGYVPMIYANRSMLTDNLNADALSPAYDIWLAHFTEQTDYTGDYTFWQYSEKGDGAAYGAESEYIDLDYWYDNTYSSVFDAEYFAGKYPDIAASVGDDPVSLLNYFVSTGMDDGLQGCASFDVISYKSRYRDLRMAFGSDLREYYWHYMTVGEKEGRDASYCGEVINPITEYDGIDFAPVYDYEYCRNTVAELIRISGVENAGELAEYVMTLDDIEMLALFADGLMDAGTPASPDFEVHSYAGRYVDLRRAFGSDLRAYYMHYLNYGFAEGRNGTESDIFYDAETVYDGVDYSDVYDYTYYINANPDVFLTFNVDDLAVLEHFVTVGMDEGEQGIADFDAKSYANRYVDLRRAFGSDRREYYLHYMNHGKAEGRDASYCEKMLGAVTVYDGVDYSAVYDYEYYSTYGDLRAAFGEDDAAMLKHFVECGMSEGRQGSADFDAKSYRRRYVDLRRAFGSDLREYYRHYMDHGKAEGRDASYCEKMLGAPTVYDGVDYSAVYDYEYYKIYRDVRNALGDDDVTLLKHFVEYGMDEGRQGIRDFNPYVYRDRYADLRAAFGDDMREYYWHYMNYGKDEGRTAI